MLPHMIKSDSDSDEFLELSTKNVPAVSEKVSTL